MSAPASLDNLDVWQEILKHFEVSFETDDPAVVKEKKSAALTVALLSRRLVGAGLDTLWKDMSSIIPIANVINSWDGGAVQYLLYHNPTSTVFSPAWHLFRPILDPGLREHIEGYLMRIRTVHVQLEMKEIELWGLISTLLHSTSILPNIRHLLVRVDATFIASGNAISNLLSPSLTSITLMGSWSIYLRTIQNYILSHQLPELVELDYRNDPREVPQDLQHFPKLKCLRTGGETLFGLNSKLVDRLNTLVNIEELQISLRPDGLNPNNPLVPPFALPNLRILRLTIFYPVLLQSLLLTAHLPSLHTLSVTILVGASGQAPLLSTAIPAVQNLRHLSIRMAKGRPTNTQTFTDFNEFEAEPLTALTSIKSLETLELTNMPYRSVETNLETMVRSWSKLRALSIGGSDVGESFMAASALLQFARCPELRKITLSLDFAFLTEPLLAHTQQPQSRLRELRCHHWKGIPAKGPKKIIVVRNLLRLFPDLRRIILAQDEDGLMEELQEFIVSYRELLVHQG